MCLHVCLHACFHCVCVFNAIMLSGMLKVEGFLSRDKYLATSSFILHGFGMLGVISPRQCIYFSNATLMKESEFLLSDPLPKPPFFILCNLPAPTGIKICCVLLSSASVCVSLLYLILKFTLLSQLTLCFFSVNISGSQLF